MPNIGPMELIIVLALALIVLGPKRLPDAGRSLGSGLRNFKRGLSTDEPAEPAELPFTAPGLPDAAPDRAPAASTPARADHAVRADA